MQLKLTKIDKTFKAKSDKCLYIGPFCDMIDEVYDYIRDLSIDFKGDPDKIQDAFDQECQKGVNLQIDGDGLWYKKLDNFLIFVFQQENEHISIKFTALKMNSRVFTRLMPDTCAVFKRTLSTFLYHKYADLDEKVKIKDGLPVIKKSIRDHFYNETGRRLSTSQSFQDYLNDQAIYEVIIGTTEKIINKISKKRVTAGIYEIVRHNFFKKGTLTFFLVVMKTVDGYMAVTPVMGLTNGDELYFAMWTKIKLFLDRPSQPFLGQR